MVITEPYLSSTAASPWLVAQSVYGCKSNVIQKGAALAAQAGCVAPNLMAV